MSTSTKATTEIKTTEINHDLKLQELSNNLFMTLDENHFFNTIAAYFFSEMAVTNVMAYLYLDNGQAELLSINGQAQKELLTTLTSSHAYMLRTKKGYFSNQALRDPIFANENAVAQLCFPIVYDQVVLGSIHCQIDHTEKTFTKDDMNKCMKVIGQLKIQIQNMKMYLTAKNLNRTLLLMIENKEKEELSSGNKNTHNYKEGMISEKPVLGNSAVMKELLTLVDKVADKEISAMLIGEASTGKEMIAKRIHCRSVRKNRPFLMIDCAATNEYKLGQELFGIESEIGLLERANYGTVYIQSIEKMPMNIQLKLIQFINSKMGVRIDGQNFFKSDVRILSSSSKEIIELSKRGEFREELYFALSTIMIKTPSLKERLEDIELLANYFLNEVNKNKGQYFSPSAIRTMKEYTWPGNIRELINVIDRSSTLNDGPLIEELYLDQNKKEELKVKAEREAEEKKLALNKTHENLVFITLEELEKNHILQTLASLSGNKTKSAKALGITVKTLYNKLNCYGLEIESKEA